jgi:hypothetical protein
MATTLPTLSDALTDILNAIAGIIGSVAQTIAANASVIGTVVVIGGLVYLVARYGGRAMSSLSGFFKGFGF